MCFEQCNIAKNNKVLLFKLNDACTLVKQKKYNDEFHMRGIIAYGIYDWLLANDSIRIQQAIAIKVEITSGVSTS